MILARPTPALEDAFEIVGIEAFDLSQAAARAAAELLIEVAEGRLSRAEAGQVEGQR